MKIAVMVGFCFVLMVFILIKTINEKSIGKLSKKYFILCIIFALIMLVTDGLSILIDDGTIKTSIPFNYFVQITYFSYASICCYFVFLLMDSLGGKQLLKNRKPKVLLSIPVYIYMIFVITSIWTGLIFSIDESNDYIRGPLNFFQFIFSYGYIMAALALSLYKYIKGGLDPNRDIYFANLLFCLMPTLGGVCQFAVSVTTNIDLPLISAGLALSTVIIFVEMIQNQVSIDSLTGLAGRKAFYKYLYSINKSNVTHLFVYMIDIDKFKAINDNFGHLEGDNALVLFAQALKIHTRQKRGYAARIGGDEFAIAVELVNNNPDDYLQTLNDEIDNINKKYTLEYNIAASVGYARLENDGSIKNLIQHADDEMYRIKSERKRSNR